MGSVRSFFVPADRAWGILSLCLTRSTVFLSVGYPYSTVLVLVCLFMLIAFRRCAKYYGG